MDFVFVTSVIYSFGLAGLMALIFGITAHFIRRSVSNRIMSDKEEGSIEPNNETGSETQNNENLDFIFDITIKRYDQEFSRYQHIDQKAGTQIGFSGIIIAVLSFIFGSNGFTSIPKDMGFYLLLTGMGILLVAISFAIISLTHYREVLPIFRPGVLYQKYRRESEARQKELTLTTFLDMIPELETRNSFRARLLHYGNFSILVGLSISFISFLFISKVIV